MVAISAIITSMISYFQNMGCTMSQRGIELPEELRNIFEAITKFLVTLQKLIPQIPTFDIRVQLVVLAIGLPFIVDVIFLWFIQPFTFTVFHILDIAAIVVFSLFGVQMFLKEELDPLGVVMCGLMALWLALRWFVAFVKWCKKRFTARVNYYTLCSDVCKHFLSGILPNTVRETSLEQLNEAIQRYSSVIEISPKKIPCWRTFFLFIWACAFFGFSVVCVGLVFPDWPIPAIVRVFFPYIGYPVSLIMLLICVTRLCECGRKCALKVKTFCKKWGLRLMMLALDLLYIPVLTMLVACLMPTYEPLCAEGEYLSYVNGTIESQLRMFIVHDAICVPCSENLSDFPSQCYSMCSGMSEYRMIEDMHLLFKEDILHVVGGVMIFTVIIIMIGIPVLYTYIINRNSRFVAKINVYGDTSEVKWRAVLNRLDSTGVFLFVNYQHKQKNWSVFILITKFVIMGITAVAGRWLREAIFILPFIYAIVFITVLVKKPYLYPFNNFLDAVLYIVNTIFALIPCLSYFGVRIPEGATIPCSIVMATVPVISLVFLLCCKSKLKIFAENDPTIVEKLTEEQLIERRTRILKQMRRRERRKRLLAQRKMRREREGKAYLLPQGNVNKTQTQTPTLGNYNAFQYYYGNTFGQQQNSSNGAQQPIQLEEIQEEDSEIIINEDMHKIELGMLDTVEEAMEKEGIKLEEDDDDVEPCDAVKQTEAFTINKRTLAMKMQAMYEMLDVIVDGSTIDFLLKTFNGSMLLAACAFGWYVGALLLRDEEAYSKIIECS